ncbi:MAG: hypothetical protein AAB470_01065 [Patescibacteria group bacterium]
MDSTSTGTGSLKKSVVLFVQMKCEELIANKPELYYDESLFWKICHEIGEGGSTEKWCAQLNPASTMLDMLSVIPPQLQQQFLRTYIERFERMLKT